MAAQQGNQTPNTTEVSESELRGTTVDDLRREAKEAGVSGTGEGAGPDEGELRTGNQSNFFRLESPDREDA